MTIQLERGPQLYSPDTGKRLTLAQSRALTAMRAAFVAVLEAFDATGDETMPADGYPFPKCFREVTADVMEYVDSMDEPAIAATLEEIIGRPRLGEDAPEPESVVDDGHPPPCTNPEGHSWVCADTDNGGDGRTYCEFCLADGDA